MYLSFVNCRLITAAFVVYWNVFSKKNICVALGLILFTFLFIFYNFHHCFSIRRRPSCLPSLVPMIQLTEPGLMTLSEGDGCIQNIPQVHKRFSVTPMLLHRFYRIRFFRVIVEIQKSDSLHQRTQNHLYVTRMKITLKSTVR